MSFYNVTVRLMMSESSALPDTIFKQWKEVTGEQLQCF